MAEAMGVTPKTISDWEMGIRERRGLAKRIMVILAERNGVKSPHWDRPKRR
jgi:DNA-binding transcriptional regulator YiaG